MTRANARELAVHLIYSQGFSKDDPESIIDARLNREYYKLLASENEIYADTPSAAQRHYLDTIVVGVCNREDELNEIISRYAIGWDVRRISRLTRCIMQVAIFETLYLDDVPTSVAISEAIRLTKKYDGEEASAFSNGILGSFSRALPVSGDAPCQ